MEKIKQFFRTTKGKVLTGCTAAAVLIAVGIIVFIIIKNNGYRSIAVEDVSGTVNIVGEKNNGQAFKGEHLFSGDDVSVLDEAVLTMCMDSSKHVYAEENTHFKIESVSDKNSSKIKIVLDKGSELNVLSEKLGANDSYQVDAPNSTMSVRGTVFRMTVYNGSDGYIYTLLEVEEGVVLAQLKTLKGDYNGVEREFYAGESALIRGGDDFSEFLLSETGEEVLLLDYNSLPKEGVPRLIELLKRLTENTPDPGKETTDNEPSPDPDTGTDKKPSEDPDTNDPETEHTHTFGKWQTITEATCEKAGEKKRVCSECGEEEIETIPAAGHSFKEVVDKDATCKNAGSKHNECSVCGEKGASETIPATGNHKWTEVVDKEPTCKNDGSKHDECSVCGDKKASEVIPATGNHTWKEIIDKEPTCVDDGSKHEECSVCGDKKTSETIPATGIHTWKEIIDKQPTCKDEGSKHDECSVCGKKQTSETIPATGNHTWKEVIDKDPNCTDEGSKHQECTVCGDKKTSETIAALGHNFVWSVVPGAEATCEHDGAEEHKCTRCGLIDDRRSVAKKPHEYEEISRIQSAAAGGWDVTYRCKHCGNEITVHED